MARRAWPVLMFVLGLLLSAIILESAKRKGVRSRNSIPPAIEEVLLLAFLLWGSRFIRNGEVRPPSEALSYCLVALPSLAMGCRMRL
jgi:hypothetical protein